MKYALTVMFIFITTIASNKTWEYPTLPVKVKIVDITMPPIMEVIAYQESKNNWYAINHNSNGTIDLGKYQLNTIAFKELNKVYNLPIPNQELFLSDTLMQKQYALKLYEHNVTILKRRRKKIDTKNIIKAWAVSGYNV